MQMFPGFQIEMDAQTIELHSLEMLGDRSLQRAREKLPWPKKWSVNKGIRDSSC